LQPLAHAAADELPARVRYLILDRLLVDPAADEVPHGAVDRTERAADQPQVPGGRLGDGGRDPLRGLAQYLFAKAPSKTTVALIVRDWTVQVSHRTTGGLRRSLRCVAGG